MGSRLAGTPAPFRSRLCYQLEPAQAANATAELVRAIAEPTHRREYGASDLSRSRRLAVPNNRLALNDSVDFEVFDRWRPVSEARLRADSHHLFAPRLRLFTRVPYLKDPDLSVFADRGSVKQAPGRWGVADPELLAHLVVLIGCDPRLDEPCCCHTNLLAGCPAN